MNVNNISQNIAHVVSWSVKQIEKVGLPALPVISGIFAALAYSFQTSTGINVGFNIRNTVIGTASIATAYVGYKLFRAYLPLAGPSTARPVRGALEPENTFQKRLHTWRWNHFENQCQGFIASLDQDVWPTTPIGKYLLEQFSADWNVEVDSWLNIRQAINANFIPATVSTIRSHLQLPATAVNNQTKSSLVVRAKFELLKGALIQKGVNASEAGPLALRAMMWASETTWGDLPGISKWHEVDPVFIQNKVRVEPNGVFLDLTGANTFPQDPDSADWYTKNPIKRRLHIIGYRFQHQDQSAVTAWIKGDSSTSVKGAATYSINLQNPNTLPQVTVLPSNPRPEPDVVPGKYWHSETQTFVDPIGQPLRI